MPTASGGRASALRGPGRRTSSMMMTTTPSPRRSSFSRCRRRAHALRERNQRGLRAPARPGQRRHAKPRFCIQLQNGGMIGGRTTPMTRAALLPRGSRPQLAGLEVLQVIVRDRRNAEHDCGGEQRVGDEQLCYSSVVRPRPPPEMTTAVTDDDQQAPARHGRVRQTDGPPCQPHRRDQRRPAIRMRRVETLRRSGWPCCARSACRA